MAFRRKGAEPKATEPKAPRTRAKRPKPEPPTPPTFEPAPTLTSDERYAEAEAVKPARVRTITDHDEEW